MEGLDTTFLVAKDVQEILYHLRTVSDVQILGGATQRFGLKSKAVSLIGLPELSTIEKKERYIDAGSAVTLSNLLNVGKNRLPSVLYSAIESIGTESLRNIATIGGNICGSHFYHTLYAPLLALGTRLEFKKQNETLHVPFSKFKGVPEKSFLSKIRIPLYDWDVEIFRRLGPGCTLSPLSASFCFLLSSKGGYIVSIKIVFAGQILFNSPELENRIVGMKLPLTGRQIDNLIELAEQVFLADEKSRNAPPILKAQFLNLVRNSFEQLM